MRCGPSSIRDWIDDVATLVTPARADVEDAENHYDPGPAQRRSGFTAGLFFGPAGGASDGYLNELAKIGNPDYRQNTGFVAGSSSGFWLGGALRDWFVFGLGFRGATIEGNGKRSEGSSFVLHVEAFPLFARGGVFRDISLFSEFGAGSRKIVEHGQTVADAGFVSQIAVGAQWEAFRFWSHFAGGPMLLVSHEWSESMTTTYGALAFRLAFYGGP